jgi:peptide/nickel transport system ATP-binding protein
MTMAPGGAEAPGGGVLHVEDLTVAFPTRDGVAVAVNSVSLRVGPGEIRGIVGESGSGKTMLCRAILGLVPWPGAIVHGSISWRGRDLATASKRVLREVRGPEISMIFQDPAAALNPVFSVGEQIAETIRVHRGLRRAAARDEAIELLGRVGIPSPRERYNAYPHQLSGGMRQRAMIAIAISCRPGLILADEPTTSLDVTIQDQILRLLRDLREEYGIAMVLVSHDLGVVSQHADAVDVMYSGSIMESAPTDQLFSSARHPYTAGLLGALPSIKPAGTRAALVPIPGQPPALDALEPGCPFAPRCAHARAACRGVDLHPIEVSPRHTTACPFTVEGIAGP